MSVFASLYRQLSALDLDEIFSYNTTKEVRMLDRRLGLVCNLIRLIVLAYVLVYVFWYREGYAVSETSVGHTIAAVNGTTYSVSSGVIRPWDAVDVVAPAIENSAAFIATTLFLTKEQKVTNFSNTAKPCHKNTEATDCPFDPPLSYGFCREDGFCQVMDWLPAFSENDPDRTVRHEMVDADKQIFVLLRSTIQFPAVDPSRIFSTINERAIPYKPGSVTEYASTSTSKTLGVPGATTMPPDYYSLGDLLDLAGTSYETIKGTGATLSVSFSWTCFVDSAAACAPQLQVARLDTYEKRHGYQTQYAHYYRAEKGDEGTRDLYTARGVRLLLTTRGEGKKVSINAIMVQISSCIALLWLAGVAADFIMIYVLPERKHYRTYKQERTPDFSDLRNKIAEVEGEKKKLRDRKNRFAAKLDES